MLLNSALREAAVKTELKYVGRLKEDELFNKALRALFSLNLDSASWW